MMVTKLGSELKVGDLIKVWWPPGRDRIVSLRPYTGPLANLFPQGAQIAAFEFCSGMTIENHNSYQIAA